MNSLVLFQLITGLMAVLAEDIGEGPQPGKVVVVPSLNGGGGEGPNSGLPGSRPDIGSNGRPPIPPLPSEGANGQPGGHPRPQPPLGNIRPQVPPVPPVVPDPSAGLPLGAVPEQPSPVRPRGSRGAGLVPQDTDDPIPTPTTPRPAPPRGPKAPVDGEPPRVPNGEAGEDPVEGVPPQGVLPSGRVPVVPVVPVVPPQARLLLRQRRGQTPDEGDGSKPDVDPSSGGQAPPPPPPPEDTGRLGPSPV